MPSPEPEFMRTAEAQAWLLFPEGHEGMRQFFKWADKYAVPRLHRGRTVLWERRVIRDFLERKPWTLRRGSNKSAAA